MTAVRRVSTCAKWTLCTERLFFTLPHQDLRPDQSVRVQNRTGTSALDGRLRWVLPRGVGTHPRGPMQQMGVEMSEPLATGDDLLPEVDDITLAEDEPLPDVFDDVPDPGPEEEDLPEGQGIGDVDDIPDVPGGDFLNRRSEFPGGLRS
jgi:hypothetical protein